MNTLARVDLERLRIDSESFLGQAIALGMRFRKLPEHTADAMLAYLRTAGMAFARRRRTGIAPSREGIERGVQQALVCMELGLEDAAGGDLNVAVDLLVQGDFETFRKRGWEIAFFRLEEMQEASRMLPERPEVVFLQDCLQDVGRWARLTPETWMRPPDEDGEEEEAQPVDPMGDYAAFREIRARAAFLEALPRTAFLALLDLAEEGAAFDALLRNLILCLALDLETLAPDRSQVAMFRARCFEGGAMRPEVREKVLRLLDRQLGAVMEEEAHRRLLRTEAEMEIALLERASENEMTGFFMVKELEEGGGDMTA